MKGLAELEARAAAYCAAYVEKYGALEPRQFTGLYSSHLAHLLNECRCWMVEKPLIVGQAPGPSGCGEPVGGRIGRRLAGYMGVTLEEFLERFDRENLVDRYPGRSGEGDAFPAAEARERARKVCFEDRPYVLLLGRGVAGAFGLGAQPWLTWAYVKRVLPAQLGTVFVHARVAVVPHPSGRNRWWNEQANRERAGEFLGDLPG